MARSGEQDSEKIRREEKEKRRSRRARLETNTGGSSMQLRRVHGPPLHLRAFPRSRCTHLRALAGREGKARAWTATRRAVDDGDDDVEATAAPEECFFEERKSEGE